MGIAMGLVSASAQHASRHSPNGYHSPYVAAANAARPLHGIRWSSGTGCLAAMAVGGGNIDTRRPECRQQFNPSTLSGPYQSTQLNWFGSQPAE